MKKFLFLVIAALLVGTTVTGCKGKSESNKLNDSIAEILGKMTGTQLKAQLQFNPNMANDLDKDQLMKGMIDVFNMDTTKNSQSYIQGLQWGMQFYHQLAQLEVQGVHVDRKLFINEFKKALEGKDTLKLETLEQEFQNTQMQIMGMIERAQKARAQRTVKLASNTLLSKSRKTKISSRLNRASPTR